MLVFSGIGQGQSQGKLLGGAKVPQGSRGVKPPEADAFLVLKLW